MIHVGDDAQVPDLVFVGDDLENVSRRLESWQLLFTALSRNGDSGFLDSLIYIPPKLLVPNVNWSTMMEESADY
jgi:hypothetical protein